MKIKDELTDAIYQHPTLGMIKFDDIKDIAIWRELFILEYDRNKLEIKILRTQRNNILESLVGANDE